MGYIKEASDIPGIRGLFQYRPETAKPMGELADALLVKDSDLEKWEREMIATYVSNLNECKFCCKVHGEITRELLPEQKDIVELVKEDYRSAPISDKLKALLAIAAKVQEDARKVLPADIENARKAGATDLEIHDTVLIAAAFCMFNKYVDGLGCVEYENMDVYRERAKITAEEGYL